jgi:hypothetical protein
VVYVFAILALLGVGTFAVAAFGERYLSFARELWAMVSVAFGIGLAWLADFDMFALWNVGVRERWIGITLSGLAIGAIAYVTYGAAHLLSAYTRKVTDEAAGIEKDKSLKRVA